MSTWEEIGEKWSRAQQMGFQAVQAALDVGDDLLQKKLETPKGDWLTNVTRVLHSRMQASRLMRLALHRELIEENRPDSMRGALALLPRVPKKTSDKQLTVKREESDKLEDIVAAPVKKQAEVLADKKVKAEIARLQNQARLAITQEVNALQKQLEKERKRVSELMAETAKQRQFYEDLINKRMNGYDFKAGFKVLKMVVHPDKKGESTEAMQTRAMDVIKHIEELLQL